MMTGTLRVQSFSARQSAPVPGVFVTLTNADAVAPRPYTFYTDDEGMAEDVCLPTPDEDLSLDENNTQRPYSVWNLTAEKEGYQTVNLEGIQAFACEVALVELEMLPMQRRGAPNPLPETFDVPPHSLYRPEGPSSQAPVQRCPVPQVLEVPIIPTNVTVHLGRPTSSAQNVTVSFRHYIANVASSEVYPTWVGSTTPTIPGL